MCRTCIFVYMATTKQNREEQINIRLTAQERAAIEAAALIDQRTITDWARRILLIGASLRAKKRRNT